ncbi:MAG: putative integral rane protein [Micrococcaceae bacterium]|nr:putative integral rane protein [Micrococcaceae bacterium]
MNPRTLFRTVAVAEAVTWAFLLLGMFFKYVTRTTEALVPPAGAVHGFVFLCFVVATLFIWINQRWSIATGLLGLASAIVPFATVPFERWIERRGRLTGGWRLAPGAEAPRNSVETLQAWVLRSPLVALLVAIVGISVVFSVLLLVGPPGSAS